MTDRLTIFGERLDRARRIDRLDKLDGGEPMALTSARLFSCSVAGGQGLTPHYASRRPVSAEASSSPSSNPGGALSSLPLDEGITGLHDEAA